MSKFDIGSKEVSGPINVVRLEGEINGIKKVIYLFMDLHVSLENQTECMNFYSKDINKYFLESFGQLNKMKNKYDFFLEIGPTRIFQQKSYVLKQIYIFQIFKLFSNIFKYNPKTKKVNISDIFNNVRLHYFDIRDYIEEHVYVYLLQLINITSGDAIEEKMDDIIYLLEKIKKEIDLFIEIYFSSNTRSNKKTVTIKEYKGPEYQLIENMLYKMKNVYNHKKIKEILNKIFKEIFIDLKDISSKIDNYINTISQDIILIDSSHNKLVLQHKGKYTLSHYYNLDPLDINKIAYDITNMGYFLDRAIVGTFAKIIDIYFLRRFLDKNYITNAIVYSGSAHSEMYIKILLTHFNFNITHVSYSLIKNLTKLNEEIRKRDLNDLSNLFLPPDLYQCSDISHFPENFL